MSAFSRISSVLLLLAPSVLAQGAVTPAPVRPKQDTPGLRPPNVPASNVQQVNMLKLPGDPPGTWTCTLTCGGLFPANGGVSGLDLLSGKYDAINDVFTPDLLAAGCNAAGDQFGLMLDPSGLIAVWDLIPGFPQLATRPNVTSPFVPIGGVIGLPAQSYFDPALTYYNGQLYLLHVLGTSIAMSPLDLTTRQVGTSRVIITAARAGATANSPTPIMTSGGDLICVSHHDVLGSDNDHYMSFDLDPNTQATLFIDTTTWINNGGFCGGTFYDAESSPTYHIFDVQTIWWSGGRAQRGNSMEISAYSPPSMTALYQSFFFISRGFIAPLAIPTINGLLGIDPTLLIVFNIGVHQSLDGVATTSLPIPLDASLAGLALPAQGLTLDLATLQVHLLNTATIKIE